MPGSDRQRTLEGLTSAEAAERLRRAGPNELAASSRFARSLDGSRVLSSSSWGVGSTVATGIAIPFTPLAGWLGFTPLPPVFFAALVTMIVAYLGVVEVVKRWFYRRYLI